VFDRASYEAVVREDFPVDGVLLTVHASDADRGRNAELVYWLAGASAAEHGHLFAVDRASGAVSLRAALDRETADQYELVVAAADRGSSPTTAYTQVQLSSSSSPPSCLSTNRVVVLGTCTGTGT